MSVKISAVEFVAMVLGSNNGHFKSIDVYNDVSLKGGKKCPYFGAKKRQSVSGRMGQTFDSLLKASCESVGVDFTTYQKGEMPWGTKVNANFIKHTLKDGEKMVYLVFVAQSYGEPTYYACNGSPIDASDIKEWLTPPRENVKVIDGVEVPLKGKYTPYRLDSIEGCHMGGEDYTLDLSDLDQVIAMF